jgi:murein DD-endopeptidase MepM/ murein hydrolase activator NlpD
MARRFLITVSLLLTLPAAALEVRRECRDDYVCVVTEEVGDSVTLWAEPQTEFPIALTISVRAQHLDAIDGRRRTVTLMTTERQRLLRFRRDSSDRRYSLRIWWDWSIGVLDAEHDDSVAYSMPYQSGETYRVLQGYGARFSHQGRERYAVDFAMVVGTPVHAARNGIVARVVDEHDRGCWEDGCGRWANYIIVLHADGTTGQYYHLMQHGSRVAVGDRVTAGQLIGYSGNTGHTTMPHLHFAVYQAGSWGSKRSVPVRFRTADGELDSPRSGRSYRAE